MLPLQLLVVAVGNSCNKTPSAWTWGITLEVTAFCPGGSSSSLSPCEMGYRQVCQPATALETWSMGRWGRGGRC